MALYSRRSLGALSLAVLLSACGVDGPPEPPPPRDEPATGVSVTIDGEARAGVVGLS